MLVIAWDAVKESGLTLDFQADAADFLELQLLVDNGECQFTGPVDIQLHAVPVSGMIEVSGTAEVPIQISCTRCLQEFDTPLRARFELTFVREAPLVHDEADEEIELSADDLGLIEVPGDEIDLRQPIAEQLILALPIKALCREDCKGLCSQCGADLNLEPCGCEKSGSLGTFAALKDFKVKKS